MTQPERKNGRPIGNQGAVPAERINTIRQLLSRGWSHGKIYALLEPKWNVSRVTLWKYIQQVYAALEEEEKEERPHFKRKMREALKEFYEEARAKKQYPTALQTLDRLARIDGCYEPERIEMSGGVSTGPTVHITSINFHSLSEAELEILKRVLLPEEKKPALLNTANVVDMK